MRYWWHRLLVRLGLRKQEPIITPELIAKVALANLGNNLVLKRIRERADG